MAALEELVIPEEISQLLESHMFEEISLILQDEYPDIRGLSVKNIKRFCQTYGIKKRGFVPDDELNEIVATSVQQVLCIRVTRSAYKFSTSCA